MWKNNLFHLPNFSPLRCWRLLQSSLPRESPHFSPNLLLGIPVAARGKATRGQCYISVKGLKMHHCSWLTLGQPRSPGRRRCLCLVLCHVIAVQHPQYTCGPPFSIANSPPTSLPLPLSRTQLGHVINSLFLRLPPSSLIFLSGSGAIVQREGPMPCRQ